VSKKRTIEALALRFQLQTAGVQVLTGPDGELTRPEKKLTSCGRPCSSSSKSAFQVLITCPAYRSPPPAPGSICPEPNGFTLIGGLVWLWCPSGMPLAVMFAAATRANRQTDMLFNHSRPHYPSAVEPKVLEPSPSERGSNSGTTSWR
jgi:hypothetical protein